MLSRLRAGCPPCGAVWPCTHTRGVPCLRARCFGWARTAHSRGAGPHAVRGLPPPHAPASVCLQCRCGVAFCLALCASPPLLFPKARAVSLAAPPSKGGACFMACPTARGGSAGCPFSGKTEKATPRLLWGFCAVAQKPARSVCGEVFFSLLDF